MCRIAGIIDFSGGEPFGDKLVSMRDSMARGGPDGSGIHIDGKIGLAHRRLSILDLSAAASQPMRAQGRDVWLSYNGEIYNFQELKQELLAAGYRFKSSSDTEVILNGYLHWGESVFSKLKGMFALSILDKDRKCLLLARDRAGIKPLYYSISRERFLFASEVKAFKAFDSRWPEYDKWKVLFLAFGHIPFPFTTLKNVFSSPKGEYLRVDLEKNSLENVKYSAEIQDDYGDNPVRTVRRLLEHAVNSHLVADAPLGVFLSGGLDSTLIASIAARVKGEELRTLSVCFSERDYDESSFQNAVAKQIRSRHSARLVREKDFLEEFEGAVASMDQPTTDGINTFFISKCAKEAGLKAVLSGLGSDEIFGGYPSFNRMPMVWTFRKSGIKAFDIFSKLHGDRIGRLSYLSMRNPIKYYLLMRAIFPESSVAAYSGYSTREVREVLEGVPSDLPMSAGPLQFASFMERDFYMQNQLLKDSDSMGMANSVEIRVPFVDQDLSAAVLAMPPEVKFGGRPKSLLLEAFKPIIPQQVFSREKMGFAFPFPEWMGRNAEQLLDSLNCPRSVGPQLLRRFRAGDLHWSRFFAVALANRN